jgi:hypothetical protein
MTFSQSLAQSGEKESRAKQFKKEVKACLSQGSPKQCKAEYERFLTFLEASSQDALYFEELIRKSHLVDQLAPNKIEALVLKKLATFPEGALKNTIMSNGYLKLTILYYYAQEFDQTERTALIAL